MFRSRGQCRVPAAKVPCRAALSSSSSRCLRLTICAGSKSKACTVSVDPLEPMQIQCNGPTCRIPVTLTAIAAIAAAYWFKRQAQEPGKKLPEPWPEMPNPSTDPVAYQKALARTRQAQDVQRAVGFMNSGERARAMVELHKALEENAVCRSPLLDGHQTRNELVGLYSLHIENTEVPPNFAVLLQLRQMLGLDADTAEQIEEEVLRQSQAFSI
uniref:Uncharacterized protein n=1 Tax=Tetradesmus obliquus TaxID=3088 RepID=A0A383V8S7_TETOB|eukprot:jgi/Sobl393_1/3386/SZX61977.1